jgi:hypothetical protein
MHEENDNPDEQQLDHLEELTADAVVVSDAKDEESQATKSTRRSTR